MSEAVGEGDREWQDRAAAAAAATAASLSGLPASLVAPTDRCPQTTAAARGRDWSSIEVTATSPTFTPAMLYSNKPFYKSSK